MKLVGISGSLRKNSLNTALLEHVAANLPDGVTLQIADISQVPLFNQDLEQNPPESVDRFKSLVAHADGVLFASPEYNHGLSGVMKNAIDWLSRPPAESSIKGKPCGIMGASPSFVGTARAQEQLKLAIAGVGAIAYNGPHVLVGSASGKFTGGVLSDDKTKGFVDAYVAGFIESLEAR